MRQNYRIAASAMTMLSDDPIMLATRLYRSFS